MKIAFTICSNNYLAQAKTLGDSLLKFNPEYKFFIVLVDKLSPEIDYPREVLHEIITIEEIEIEGFNDLWKRYNIIELNTCVKPSIFRYLFNRYQYVSYLIYFDPDILIFDNIQIIESEFETNDIILTPHIIHSLSISEQRPNEYDFLNYGIYNIGFLGLRKSNQIMNDFLPWWEERTLKLGFIKPALGLFVDQIWFNIVTLFFRKICILTNPGCNVAPWNIHERELTQLAERVVVNSKDNLIFFHFSTFKYYSPKILFYNYDRNNNYINATLESMYSSYCELLIENRIESYSSIKSFYTTLKENFEFEQKQSEKLNLKVGDSKNNFKRIIKNFSPAYVIKKMKHLL